MTAPVANGPYLEMALESQPNYEGAANAVSTYLSYPPFEELTDNEKATMLEQKQIANGFLGPMPHVGVAKYDPEFALGKASPRPSHLGFLCALHFGSWTSVAGDGDLVVDPDGNAVPVGGYLHTFVYKFDLMPQTARMRGCTGDGRHRYGSGVALSDLGFAWENGAMTVDPKGLALVMKDVEIGSTELPTEVTPIIDLDAPYRRGDLTITWLDNTAFTTDFSFKFAAAVEAKPSPVAASLYPTGMLYKNAYPLVSGEIDKAILNADDWNALANGTQFAAKVKVAHRSTIGEDGYQPGFWAVMPGCQLTAITRNAIKAERRREGKYAWESRIDPATGNFCTVTVVNTTPDYKAGWTS